MGASDGHDTGSGNLAPWGPAPLFAAVFSQESLDGGKTRDYALRIVTLGWEYSFG